jgi:tRNA (mo5U34)-methyltransferase
MSTTVRTLPPAPPGFRIEQIQDVVHWHQRWEIFDGVFTPGINPIDEMCERMQLPADLTDKRVLDIGAWNGCLSFECERRGAEEVLAIGPEPPDRSGFNRLADLVGATRTRYQFGSVYDLDPERIGTFDVVLFCGVLYHLRYPVLGIDNLRRVARGELFVETFLSDLQLTVAGQDVQALPLWRFYRHDELERDPSNWFGPTAFAVVQALESAGFEVRHAGAWNGRGVFRAVVKPGMPEFLAEPTVEGVYYDTIVRHLYGHKDVWNATAHEVSSSTAQPADAFNHEFFASDQWALRRKSLLARVKRKLGIGRRAA